MLTSAERAAVRSRTADPLMFSDMLPPPVAMGGVSWRRRRGAAGGVPWYRWRCRSVFPVVADAGCRPSAGAPPVWRASRNASGGAFGATGGIGAAGRIGEAGRHSLNLDVTSLPQGCC